ncbi:tyrosine-type recombinase/integrase [Brucella intermedia]|uniref:tyrosine-type recombinase/integrase n=1 Tax=Brucella intermedia TaxID=94625 RepID=UPI0005BBDCFC|nr:site-specific integrase [Brucella intermedia]
MVQHNGRGSRKYVTSEERRAFLQAARQMSLETYTLARVLLETGCRISEALNLRITNVDLNEKCLYIESLKKRKKGVFRRVPVQNVTIMQLLTIYERTNKGELKGESRIFRWSRMTGYRHVVAVMQKAGISGIHATPKGLRHGFAVAALEAGAPLNMVQKWLGHAHLDTTSIYVDLMGGEERRLAERIWAYQAGSMGPDIREAA